MKNLRHAHQDNITAVMEAAAAAEEATVTDMVTDMVARGMTDLEIVLVRMVGMVVITTHLLLLGTWLRRCLAVLAILLQQITTMQLNMLSTMADKIPTLHMAVIQRESHTPQPSITC